MLLTSRQTDVTSVVDKEKNDGKLISKLLQSFAGLRASLRETTRTNSFANFSRWSSWRTLWRRRLCRTPADSLTTSLQTTQTILAILFVVEALLKILGETFSVYMNSVEPA